VRLTVAAGPAVVAWEGDVLVSPAGAPDVTLPAGWAITPGLVDLQVNGIGDAFPLEDPSSLARADEALARAGVTSWLVAAPSAPRAQVEALAAAADELARAPGSGLTGLHLEGPVLSPLHAGAHPVEHLRAGDDPDALALLDLPGVRLVTVAPEARAAMGYAATALERGIVVAAGHTGATLEQARAAIDAGVTVATHLFNAMAPVHQREPGTAIAYLLDRRARVGFIGDGTHLHDATIELILRTAGARAFLVSDAIPEGPTSRDVPEGVLAGSAITIAGAVRRLGLSHGFENVVRLATEAPASVLGMSGLGRPGARADLAIWDADNVVAGCVRAGTFAFTSDALAALL
jgi:N-acetylglucosamine-6-phosphate deacetylase